MEPGLWIAVAALVAVHLPVGRTRFLAGVPRTRSLSGGAAVTCVFVRLLPELAARHRAVAPSRRPAPPPRPRGSFSAHNRMIGDRLLERSREGGLPPAFLTPAMALRFVSSDFGLRSDQAAACDRVARWLFAGAPRERHRYCQCGEFQGIGTGGLAMGVLGGALQRFTLVAALLGPATSLAQGAAGPSVTPGSPASAVLAPAPMPGDVPLSRLLRMDVYDARGQGFGKVEDAVIDLADGRAVRLQVRTGGILGRTVAVPFGDFKVVDSDGGVVHTPLSDARLMLQVDANGLPPASVDGLHGCVDVGGRAGTAARPPGSLAALGRDSPDPPLPCPLKIATAVLRTTLAGADGSDLGAVRDIVVDAGSGRIRFIVVAVERFLSDKLVAVRPEGLRPHGAPEGAWRATVSREQLIDAPRLDAGHRPVPAQR